MTIGFEIGPYYIISNQQKYRLHNITKQLRKKFTVFQGIVGLCVLVIIGFVLAFDTFFCVCVSTL